MSYTGNNMIDGDNGSDCCSPYHNSSNCTKCNKTLECSVCNNEMGWLEDNYGTDDEPICQACYEKENEL